MLSRDTIDAKAYVTPGNEYKISNLSKSPTLC